jgi:hypothetical protein
VLAGRLAERFANGDRGSTTGVGQWMSASRQAG